MAATAAPPPRHRRPHHRSTGLLAGHKSNLAVDCAPILSYLVDERGETDEDGVDFIEYVEG